MNKELKKLAAMLKGKKGLHCEIDYGEDYGVENADTLIVVDKSGNIVAEGETAREVMEQLA